MVKKYKENLGPYLNKTLDWDRPKLYLKSDVEMLLVAVDRKGEFQGIPYNEVPDSMKSMLSLNYLTYATRQMHLKIVNYLTNYELFLLA